jgi:hypothetical protein
MELHSFFPSALVQLMAFNGGIFVGMFLMAVWRVEEENMSLFDLDRAAIPLTRFEAGGAGQSDGAIDGRGGARSVAHRARCVATPFRHQITSSKDARDVSPDIRDFMFAVPIDPTNIPKPNGQSRNISSGSQSVTGELPIVRIAFLEDFLTSVER